MGTGWASPAALGWPQVLEPMKRNWKDQFVVSVAARHGRPLLRFFLSRLPNAADAPDLVQEVYLRLLRLDRPDLIRAPEAYLFTIASNITREQALKRSSRPPHIALDDTPPEELPADIEVFGTAGPEAAAVQEDRVRRLETALAQLSPKARATLVWHRRDGCTYGEIAERLGISRNMVKKYLSQALAHCRTAIAEEEGR
jgi:RNA polymerase sigma factor (sigma-70 family)